MSDYPCDVLSCVAPRTPGIRVCDEHERQWAGVGDFDAYIERMNRPGPRERAESLRRARRDRFAAAALTGILANPNILPQGMCAELAVEQADALLSELDKEPG